jgi:NAD(P)-dependent dehydrogenase (short-subunit alcohol dehydrogenase family)
MQLNEQRIIVLGGTSGIGLATAQAAAAGGAEVVVVSSSEARVAAALGGLPDTATGRVVDLSDESDVRVAFAEIGAFDHLVYSAGEPLVLGTLDDVAIDDIRGAMGVRVWGALAAVKHGHAGIRPGGSIVLTSGTAGTRPPAGWPVGAMVCGAMEALGRALAVDLAPVRVNVISPGLVRTDLWGKSMTVAERDGMYATVASALPVGRVGEAEDVASTALHLMGAGYVTGTTVTVDGGGLLV